VTTFGRLLRGIRARHEEQGSVIVEAAIIVPLLILLTFGAIEYGLAFRDSAAVASSTRAGGRIASASTGQGPIAGSLTGEPAFAANARLSVSDSLKDLLHADPQTLVIYKADSNGNPSGTFANCNDCYQYTWNAPGKTWNGPTNSSGSFWTAQEQLDAACLTGGTLPSIGVYVNATQSFITGLFGSGKTFDHKTVMRLEPIATDQCNTP
jgi:Flp pilus assembly protein TadG